MTSGAPTLAYRFDATIWSYTNRNEVFFVSLPTEMSAAILDLVGISLNPWGTVPVDATINGFTWYSSMFPRPDRGVYDLPINAKVRKNLGLTGGMHVTVDIAITLPF